MDGLEPSAAPEPHYTKVEISKELTDHLAGGQVFTVGGNKDFVLHEPATGNILAKPLIINTSSVNFPKSEVCFLTSVLDYYCLINVL